MNFRSTSVITLALTCALLLDFGCWGRGPQGPVSAESGGTGQLSVGHQPTGGALSTSTHQTNSAANLTTQSSDSADSSGASQPNQPKAPLGYPNITSCTLPINSLIPGRDGAVVLTTTDFSTGAVGWINPRTKQVYADLGLAHTDTRLKHGDTYNFLINRFGADSITMMARDAALTYKGSFSVKGPEDASSNPHDLIIDAKGHMHVSFLGRDHVEVYDISDPTSVRLTRSIDLSVFADADGLPEASTMIACGDTYFVLIQRLNRKQGWTPVDHSYLVPVHAPTGSLYDFDGSGDKRGDGIRLIGAGISGWQQDPRDREGTRVLALNRGLQSIDLKTAKVEVVIPEKVFADRGMDRWDVRSFALSPDGRWLWILAIDGWPKHTIFRASLDRQGRDLTPVIRGVESVSGSMIRVDNALWLADTTDGHSGVRIFEFKGDTLAESPDSPIAVGLPPYHLHLVP